MTVELQDLEWALAAARHRSLRQAAETLGIRQSTLSRRLSDLEHKLGATLFERTNGGTQPTVAGQEFLETAQCIIEEAETAFARLRSRCHGESGRLTVGVYASLATGNLRATLTEHHRLFPEVDIYTVDGGHEKLMGGLASTAVDVAIMTACCPTWQGRTLALWSERVIVAAPALNPIGEHRIAHWSQLLSETILIAQRGPGPELEQLLTAKVPGIAPRQLVYQDVGLDRMLSLVGTGYGVSLVLEGATGAHYDNVVYRELHDAYGPTRLNFVAYWRPTNSNPALGPFIEILRQRYPDLAADPRSS